MVIKTWLKFSWQTRLASFQNPLVTSEFLPCLIVKNDHVIFSPMIGEDITLSILHKQKNNL